MNNANRFAIELQEGRRIGQLVFAQICQEALVSYCRKYQGQKGTMWARIILNQENV